jgi:hypothetical protein
MPVALLTTDRVLSILRDAVGKGCYVEHDKSSGTAKVFHSVSGRSTPARHGRLRTSHFEESQIRWIGFKETPPSLEPFHVVSDQSGHNRHHPVPAS